MDVARKCSFVRFVYPFEFKDRNFKDIQQSVGTPPWRSGSGPVWEKHAFHDQDFLPHIADFFNSDAKDQAMGGAWRMSSGAMDSPEGIGRKEHWSLSVGKGSKHPPIEFKVEEISLYLFASEVGLLVIEANPLSNDPAAWFDFVHYFRDGRSQTRIDCHLRGKPESPYFPGIAGGIQAHPDGKGSLQGLVAGILLRTWPPERWWKDAFVRGMVLPWSVLFIDHVSEDDVPGLVYRARNMFHSKQELHLAEVDRRLADPDLLQYADRQWFTFALGGAGFIAFDSSNEDFFRVQLPRHLGDSYFALYLLVLHQRFTLAKLSYGVAECCPVSEQLDSSRVRKFKEVRDALLRFTARGYFTQASPNEHQHRFYAALQKAMQIEQLYREVSEEVRDLFGALMLDSSEKQQQLSNKLNRVVLTIGLLSVVAAILGINVEGYTLHSDGIPWWHAVGFLALGGVIALVIQLRWQRARPARHHGAGAQDDKSPVETGLPSRLMAKVRRAFRDKKN